MDSLKKEGFGVLSVFLKKFRNLGVILRVVKEIPIYCKNTLAQKTDNQCFKQKKRRKKKQDFYNDSSHFAKSPYRFDPVRAF